MLNGEGLRVVLWLSGCSHHCEDCHNPITWNPNDGLEFDVTAMDEILTELNHSYISGLTLSGGDPLFKGNLTGVYNLIKDIRNKFGDSKTIWLYSGYTIEDILENQHDPDFIMRKSIIDMCDVYIDGKFEKELADVKYEYAGSTNQKVIDVKKSRMIGWRKVIRYEGSSSF